MWYAKYSYIDFNGLNDTVRSTVLFYTDTDSRNFAENYYVAPDQVNSAEFQQMIQGMVDKLNEKEVVINALPIVPSMLAQVVIATPSKNISPNPTSVISGI